MKKEGIMIFITTTAISRNVGSFFLVAIALALFSCAPEPEPEHWSVKYGANYNPERERLGIRPLPDDFIVGEVMGVWYKPRFDSTSTEPKAYYTVKILTFIDDTLKFEIDEFVLMQFKEPHYGKLLATLNYIYDHSKDSLDDVDSTIWTYRYDITAYPDKLEGLARSDSLSGKGTYVSEEVDIGNSKEKADSILNAWGFSYP